MRGRVVAAILGAGVLAGCGRGPGEARAPREPYLVVWAGDADRQDSDFLAVIDADSGSRHYGKVLATIPVRSKGNEPHDVNAEQRADGRVFATGIATNRTFVFDLRRPTDGKLVTVDQPSGRRVLAAPGEPVSLPSGRVAVMCADRVGYRGEPRELFDAPGGLLELDASGRFRREVRPERDAAQTMIVAPSGGAVIPSLHLLATTNHGHGWVGTAQGEFYPGISVQVWKADGLTLKSTAVLDAGPRGEENQGPLTARAFHRQAVLYVNTHEGGALYASDSLGIDAPAFRLVFDFGPGSYPGGAAVTPDDHFYVTALAGKNRVAAFDVRDPWHPKLVSALRFDREPSDPQKARTGGPSGLAMSADGKRIAVADYTADAPAEKRDGDRRVSIVQLDPATGELRYDTAFKDEVTGEVGVDFNRTKWPHGETGPARPHGVLFVAAAPGDENEGD